jgi:hypothetical protein
MCCTLLTLLLAALTVAAIVNIPTSPSAEDLMKVQKKKAELRRKAGLNPWKL